MAQTAKRRAQVNANVKAHRARKKERKMKAETEAHTEVMAILEEYSSEIVAHFGKQPDGSLDIIWRFPRDAEERLAVVSERHAALGLTNVVDVLNSIIVERMNLQNGTPLWELGPGTESNRMTRAEVEGAIRLNEGGK